MPDDSIRPALRAHHPRPPAGSMDGFLPHEHHRATSKPLEPTQLIQALKPKTYPQTRNQPQASRLSRLKSFFRILFQVTLFSSLFAVGLFVRIAAVGQVLLVVYAIAALVFRIESRTTFALAMIALVVVPVASLRFDIVLAENFAMYAFLLLVIGTVSLAMEVRSEI